jgi:hypothetical protein
MDMKIIGGVFILADEFNHKLTFCFEKILGNSI